MAKGIANLEKADGIHCVVCGDRLTGNQQVRCTRHAYYNNDKEAWKKQWKKEWRKRPEVRQRQKQHTADYMSILAAAHGVSLPGFKLLYGNGKVNQSTPCLVEQIRKYELRALRKRTKPTTGYRNKHPLLKAECQSCGIEWFSYLSRTAGRWCKKCRKIEYEHERAARGRKYKNYQPDKQAKRRSDRTKYKSNDLVRLNARIKSGIRQSKTSKYFDMLGYSFEDLRAHLESLLPNDATWDDIKYKGKNNYRMKMRVPISKCKTKDDVIDRWQLCNIDVEEVKVRSVRKRLGIQDTKKVVTCCECGKDFESALGGKCCANCVPAHNQRLTKERVQAQRRERDKKRFCLGCGASLAGTPGMRKRCRPCSEKKNADYRREYYKRRRQGN